MVFGSGTEAQNEFRHSKMSRFSALLFGWRVSRYPCSLTSASRLNVGFQEDQDAIIPSSGWRRGNLTTAGDVRILGFGFSRIEESSSGY